MVPRSARVRFVLAIAGVLCVAGAVRAAPLTAGLPYTSYVDEGHVLRPASHMLARHSRDPGEYQYPPLLISAVAAGGLALDLFDPDDLAARARQSDGSEYYDKIEPTNLLVIGRVVTFAFALGTVLITILIGARLLGRFGGLLAGLVVAFIPALVQRSAVVIVDTPATFFVMATLLVCLKLDSPRRPLVWAAIAGAAAAGAFMSKYPSGAVLLAVVVVLAFQRERPGMTRLAQGALASITAVVVSLLVMPALYRRPSNVIDQIQAAADKYDAKATRDGYFEQFLSVREAGVVIVVLAVIGLFFLIRSRRARPLTLGWMAFALVLVGSLLWTGFQPFRNVLPVVPYLGIAVAAAILRFARWFDHTVVASRRVEQPVALALTVGLCLTMLFAGVLPVTREQAVVDSRLEAREWIQREANEGDQIVVAEELAFLPSELERFPGAVTVLPADEIAAQDPNDFDFALWGRFTNPEVRDQSLPLAWEFVREFGRQPTPASPNIGRGNQELIAIYQS